MTAYDEAAVSPFQPLLGRVALLHGGSRPVHGPSPSESHHSTRTDRRAYALAPGAVDCGIPSSPSAVGAARRSGVSAGDALGVAPSPDRNGIRRRRPQPSSRYRPRFRPGVACSQYCVERVARRLSRGSSRSDVNAWTFRAVRVGGHRLSPLATQAARSATAHAGCEALNNVLRHDHVGRREPHPAVGDTRRAAPRSATPPSTVFPSVT
jgi:hypothetical protein